MDESELRVALENEGVDFDDDDDELNEKDEDTCKGFIRDFANKEGTGRLVSNYRVILRVLNNLNRANKATILVALKALAEGISSARDEILAADGDASKLNPEQFKAAKASTVTVLFLFYKAVSEIESKYFAEQHNLSVMAAVQGKKRGKKGPSVASGANFGYWEQHRYELVMQTARLLDAPIDKIWQPGSSLYRGVTVAVSSIVSNPSAKLVRDPHVADAVFRVLGLLGAKCDEQAAIIPRLIQSVKLDEDIARAVAYGLNIMVEQHGLDHAIYKGADEVLKMSASLAERETVADRAIGTFLQEIAILNPKLTIKALPLIAQFLENESSTLRSSVLAVGSELLTWSKDESLEPENHEEQDADALSDLNDMREDVLHHLTEHMKDTNALVRNKALQIVTKLIEHEKLHLHEIIPCTETARRRLMDKAVTVRKSSIALLSAAVYSDPIIVKFTSAQFKKQIHDIWREIIKLSSDELQMPAKLVAIVSEFVQLVSDDVLDDLQLPAGIDTPEAALKHVEELLKEDEFYTACEILYLVISHHLQLPAFKMYEKKLRSKSMYLTFFKKFLNLNISAESDDDEDEDGAIHDGGVVESDRCKAKREYLAYIKNCYALAESMEKALPFLNTLLELGTTGDKSEVIECFAVLTESGYKLDKAVMVRIVEAVAHMEPNSRNDMMSYIYRIFLKGCDTEVSVIRKFLEILAELTEAQREHMGVLIAEAVSDGKLVQEHFALIWDAFGLTNPSWKPADSRFAAFMLSTVGVEKSAIITSNLDYLMETGLGPRGCEDFHLARYTCEALMLLCPKPSDEEPDKLTPSIMFPAEHSLYMQLKALVIAGLNERGDSTVDEAYKKVVELVMLLIYRTCMQPKRIVYELLDEVHTQLFTNDEVSSGIKNTERILSRYLQFVTALLGAHVFYYDQVVFTEIKRRRRIAEKTRKKKGNSNRRSSQVNHSRLSVRSARSEVSVTSTTSVRSENGSISSTPEVNELDVIIGNIGYDAEFETVREYLDKMLDESGAFRQMRTHTMFVCSKMDKWKSLQLKIACVHALSKIMSISQKSVAKTVDVFIALWPMAKESEVKCELVRSAVLLNVRYPNQMEKCNITLLSGLRNTADCVKVATLDFVTFLALNDILKIREQMTEVAICLVDDNPEIRDQAKDLLEQCEEKDNMLSNALPDILSKLSTREDICQDRFQIIMKFLLEKVKKDKMLYGFIEKLITRFRTSEQGRPCEDIAFCLNHLSFNDRSFKIVKDNLSSYADKLGNDLVHGAFVNIIISLRKSAKPDLKPKIDEFEKEITVARAKCQEQERLEQAATRKAGGTRNAPVESSDSEFVDEDNENEKTEQRNISKNKNQEEENNSEDPDATSGEEREAERSVANASRKNRRREPASPVPMDDKENASDEMEADGKDSSTSDAPNSHDDDDDSVEEKSDEDVDMKPARRSGAAPKASGVKERNKNIAVRSPPQRNKAKAPSKPTKPAPKQIKAAPQPSKPAKKAPARGGRRNARREATPEIDDTPPGGDAVFSDSD